MNYDIRRPLKKLGNKQFAEDIKKYIRSSHEFYSTKVPEMKTLAKRLHDEYSLKEFYKVFTKLWESSESERSLAVITLLLYKDDFDLNTWRFIKGKLNSIRNLDEAESIAKILGYILVKKPELKKEAFKLSKSRNLKLKKVGIISTIPLIRKRDSDLAMKIVELNMYSDNENIQKSVGILLSIIGERKPEFVKKFILKNKEMSDTTFFYATERMKELRKVRKLKKLSNNKFRKIFFWKSF